MTLQTDPRRHHPLVEQLPRRRFKQQQLRYRAFLASDIDVLLTIATRTGVFTVAEIDCLQEDLTAFSQGHYGSGPDGDRIMVVETDGVLWGFVHFGKLVITDRSWMLHWIAVDPEAQGLGIGLGLLQIVEQYVGAASGRILLIETASNPAYVYTRAFYVRQGYKLKATIEDYYSDGDHKCVFTKKMQAVVPRF